MKPDIARLLRVAAERTAHVSWFYRAASLMARIHVLRDVVANKIAAGEVVERPASVAKELLENSLDAGSARLRVEVERGGKRLVQVTDDGSGMVRDDAMLAFERHATSKLSEVKDLLSIATLGFRGEAIPSIASVSRFTLETRSEEETTGTRVEVAGGKMLNVAETALPGGTSVTVRDLFYNVPARRKFLRTEKTELAHIASLVTHYSLAHLDKSFQLAHEKGSLFSVTPVKTLRERVFQVFGAETLDQLVELSPAPRKLALAPSPVPRTQAVAAARAAESQTKHQTLQVSGFVSNPQVQKLNRNSIYTFVNGRLIRDRLLLHAISSAYHNIIPPGSFPFALLFLEMGCEEVDVNVHPSKTEVRFRHQSVVHDFVRDSIRERLMESKPVSTFPLPPEIADAGPQPAASLPYSESTRLAQQASEASSFELKPPSAPAGRFDFKGAPPIEFPSAPGSHPTPQSAPMPHAPDPPTPSRLAEDLAHTVGETADVQPQLHSRAPLREAPPETMARLGDLRPLGQIKESFIVAAGGDGLWIIDQHVAHERILFEKVLRERSQGTIESQRLLMPIIITLRADQQLKFAQIEEEFRAAGFDLEPFGNRTIAVKAAPATLSASQVEALIQEILDTPEKELRALSLEDLQRRTSATIACHAAIKVNMPLDIAKMRWLLDELAKTDCPMSCPHGRPITLKYPMKDILKAFHRI